MKYQFLHREDDWLYWESVHPVHDGLMDQFSCRAEWFYAQTLANEDGAA